MLKLKEAIKRWIENAHQHPPFGWYRRLSKDCEDIPQSSKVMMLIVMIWVMI